MSWGRMFEEERMSEHNVSQLHDRLLTRVEHPAVNDASRAFYPQTFDIEFATSVTLQTKFPT